MTYAQIQAMLAAEKEHKRQEFAARLREQLIREAKEEKEASEAKWQEGLWPAHRLTKGES